MGTLSNYKIFFPPLLYVAKAVSYIGKITPSVKITAQWVLQTSSSETT